MSFSWPSKDPNEVLDYQHDWTARLDGDTILTTTAVVDLGDVVRDSQFANSPTAGSQTVWLSAGTDGTKCHLTLQATTTGGRVMEEGITIRIKTR